MSTRSSTGCSASDGGPGHRWHNATDGNFAVQCERDRNNANRRVGPHARRCLQQVTMPFSLPKPKSVTTKEVVLTREDWERIVAVLGDINEDEDDIAAVATARADDARFAARVKAARGGVIETSIPIDVVNAKLD